MASELSGITNVRETHYMTSEMPVDSHYYEVANPNSVPERIAIVARNRISRNSTCIVAPRFSTMTLDVGISDVVGEAANVMERCYPYPENIVAVGLAQADNFQKFFPLVR